jgi:uncharacterized protein with PIN domain
MGTSRVGVMSAEQVEPIRRCPECGRPWEPHETERWKAYLTDDEPPEVVVFCPDCAERQFGS